MEFKDYYAILGVKPEDDDKAIKTAYRKLARQYHPDVSKHKDAEAKFKDIAEAYDVLGLSPSPWDQLPPALKSQLASILTEINTIASSRGISKGTPEFEALASEVFLQHGFSSKISTNPG